MAVCEVDGFETFLKQINTLGNNLEKVAKACLNESAPIVQQAWQNNLQQHKESGQLIDSIKPTKAKYNSKYNDFAVRVQPTGYAEYTNEKTGKTRTVANDLKANVLEYGKNGQPGTPMLAPAIVSTKAEVLQSMQATFDRLVGGENSDSTTL